MNDSPLQHWFSTPIYCEFIEEPALNEIQTDLLNAINDLKIKNQFSKNKNWSSSAHKLSDVSFTRDFIDELTGAQYVIIDHGNEEFTSMPKSTYDTQQMEQSNV